MHITNISLAYNEHNINNTAPQAGFRHMGRYPEKNPQQIWGKKTCKRTHRKLNPMFVSWSTNKKVFYYG